eukprot:8388240-Pyramimonas_sp.AAC.1
MPETTALEAPPALWLVSSKLVVGRENLFSGKYTLLEGETYNKLPIWIRSHKLAGITYIYACGNANDRRWYVTDQRDDFSKGVGMIWSDEYYVEPQTAKIKMPHRICRWVVGRHPGNPKRTVDPRIL